jgi:purine nucleoside permease
MVVRTCTWIVVVTLAATLSGCSGPSPVPIPVRVVVVAMFERGADEGDQAGEFQLWKERQALDARFELPDAHHDLFMNRETGVLGMVTGVGTARAAASTMAVGLDPRFDLRQAYWLIVGIAGFDPEDASLGSAAWAEYVVDGDLAHEIDAREIPADWESGYFPRRTKRPYDPARPEPRGEVYRLNPELTEWAYQLTRDTDLGDDEGIARYRAQYTGHENARRPPFVLKGDNLAATTFWHGALLNDWANRWVDYWTEGRGSFVSSAMEDTGTLQALTWLDQGDRVDRSRVLVLRTASNYTMQPPGMGAAESLVGERQQGYSGFDVSIESAYRVGVRVVHEIIENWDRYRDRTPSA